MVRKEAKLIDVSNMPELLRIAEEVNNSNQPTVLTKDGQELAEIRPAKPARKKRVPKGVLTEDDPLWKLSGSARSAEPTDASRKYEYLGQDTPQ